MSVYRGLSGAVMLTMLAGTVRAQSPSTLIEPKQKPTVTITTEPLAPMNNSTNWNGRNLNSSKGIPVLIPANEGKINSANPAILTSETKLPSEIKASPENGTLMGMMESDKPLLTQHTPVEAWLNHTQPNCCGPVGSHGPITYDLYLRTGPSFPFAGGIFNNVLSMGWSVGGGARTLFFNPDGSRASFLDLSVAYTHNNGHGRIVVPVFGIPTTIRDLSRWNVGLGGGLEWYLNGPGFVTGAGDWNLSYGFDLGGRYGTSHVTLNVIDNLGLAGTNFARRQDVIGGIYSGLNLNFEMPMGGWTLILGGRTEWAITFTDVLPGLNGTLNDLNLLFNIGVRY